MDRQLVFQLQLIGSKAGQTLRLRVTLYTFNAEALSRGVDLTVATSSTSVY